jgi:hypothetical protein
MGAGNLEGGAIEEHHRTPKQKQKPQKSYPYKGRRLSVVNVQD